MGPTWIEPSRTPSEIVACVPANEYVRSAVRSATTSAESRRTVDSLLVELEFAKQERDAARDEAESAKLWAIWAGVAAIVTLGLGIGIGLAR